MTITARPSECPADRFPHTGGGAVGKRFIDKFIREFRRRQTMEMLKTLDDSLLRDIGAEEVIGLASAPSATTTRTMVYLMSMR
jgi:hypothetical protein